MSALARKVAAVVPCKNEADRVATTVDAVRSLPQVGRVVVVDDGSTDDTSRAAEAAGAVVVRHGRNRGKAAALETGVRRVRELEGAEAAVDADAAWPAALLFVDGDLEETASNLGPLASAVLDGTADMTIATLPAQLTAGGGRGLVVGLSRRGIESLTGFHAVQPLSGMRCLSPAASAPASTATSGWRSSGAAGGRGIEADPGPPAPRGCLGHPAPPRRRLPPQRRPAGPAPPGLGARLPRPGDTGTRRCDGSALGGIPRRRRRGAGGGAEP